MITITEEQFVAEARSWIGTQYHHQGRLKRTNKHKGGCDCLGLILGVLGNLGMKSLIRDKQGRRIPFAYFDNTSYSYNPNGRKFQEEIEKHLLQISAREDLRFGDMGLFSFEGNPQHVGIIAELPNEGLTVIHCNALARRVSEHSMDKWWDKFVCGYRFAPEHWIIED